MGELGVDDVGEPGDDLGQIGGHESGRGDRRGDELDADPGQPPDGGEVDVAGEHDGALRLGGLQQQALASRRVAVPLVEVEHGAVGQRDVAEDRLLGDHRPRRRRRRELIAEPLLLHGTEHRPRRIGGLRARRVGRQDDVATRLVGAELAAVEQHHVGQRRPTGPSGR